MSPRRHQGDTGDRGRDGATGAEGRAGTTGVTGAAGAVGGSGATGAMGPAGPRGKPARNAAAAFLILMTFSFFGFVRVDQQTKEINSQSQDNAEFAISVTNSLREGCERVNVIRISLARTLQDEISQSERSLKSNLKSLENFRNQIQKGVDNKKARLKTLRVSTNDHSVKDQPYKTNCIDAFP